MEASKSTIGTPCPLSHIDRWDGECDVLIVGFGAAGACAAIEAAEAGARVQLFEAGAGAGGASALSGGEIYLGGGTPIQRAAGFVDDTEDLYNYLQMAGGAKVDEAKVRCYANGSLDHFDWLVRQGVSYKGSYIAEKIVEPETDDTLIWSGSEEAWPFSEKARPAPRGHVVQWTGMGGGRLLMDVLEARAIALGVDVHCNSRALRLIVDEKGAVHGAVVRQDGTERFVRAHGGVILATGGFVMNPDMLAQYAPDTLRLCDPLGANDDGSGIMMGLSVGAAAVHMDEFLTTCPWYPPGSLVKGIFINQDGQRFINEDSYHGRVCRHALDQPGDRVYLLVDNEIFGRPPEYSRIDIAAVGESWADVESELGMTPGSLTATVDLYNRHAANGEDPQWHKAAKWIKPLTAPPYAALEFCIGYSYFVFLTLGGLKTSVASEVFKPDGQVIPGLYAAGRATSGLPACGYGYSSGMSLADCTFFGRSAGRAAAARAGASTACEQI